MYRVGASTNLRKVIGLSVLLFSSLPHVYVV